MSDLIILNQFSMQNTKQNQQQATGGTSNRQSSTSSANPMSGLVRTSSSRMQNLLGRTSSDSAKPKLTGDTPALSQLSSEKMQQNSAKQSTLSFKNRAIGFQKPEEDKVEQKPIYKPPKRDIPGALNPKPTGSANLQSKFNSATVSSFVSQKPLILGNSIVKTSATQLQKSAFANKKKLAGDDQSASIEIEYSDDIHLLVKDKLISPSGKSDSSDRQLLFGSKHPLLTAEPILEIEHHVEINDDDELMVSLLFEYLPWAYFIGFYSLRAFSDSLTLIFNFICNHYVLQLTFPQHEDTLIEYLTSTLSH
ncbi:hypothetical protein FGO68_gene15978 [Halteria grandinella]|uniref:Uncharacterized protein n=1 Tax=Halteria grandinella TaxID=5974 RepID=A0A8J8NGT0_HALGN|nr:hypothetical protein FGO68_gene15978 [Halteria grandinella]